MKNLALLLLFAIVIAISYVQGISPPQVETLVILEPRPIQNVPGRSTLRLQCSASGDPIPVYSWVKSNYNTNGVLTDVVLVEVDNKIIITESILEIRNVNKKDDDGLYRCLATNNQGTVFKEIQISNFVMGRFQFPYRSSDSPTDVKVRIGEQAIIPCPPHGETFPEIVQWGDLPHLKQPILWYPTSRRFFSENGALVFPEVSQNDIDEIRNMQGISCLLYNDKVYEQSRKVFLESLGTRIKAERPRFMISIKPSFAEVKGQRLVLRCGATGSPVPVVEWQKDNVIIEKIGPNRYNFERFRIEGDGVVLSVDLVHERDRGLYRCTARNGAGSVTQTGTLSVHFPPEWLQMVNDASVPIHGTHQLNCSAFADPDPSYEWYKNGTKITPGFNPRLTPKGGTLTLTRVLEEDSGMYTCLARNPHGSITTTSQIKVQTMEPKFEPPIPDPIYLFRNRVNSIPCRPIGGPKPTTEWQKDGTPISGLDTNGRITTNTADGSLVVTNPIDNDAGTYKCLAKNFLGTDESSGMAKVVDPTVIRRAPANISINVGFFVQIFCDASHDRDLELKIDWLKDGQLITYFDERIYLDWRISGPSRVLTITSTEFNDRGSYTCHAYTSLEGLISEDSGTGFLTVRAKPDRPTGVSTTDSCDDLATKLVWRRASPNGDDIRSFIIEYSSTYTDDGGKWYLLLNLREGSLETLEIEKLPGNADLIFRVSSTNKIGTSDPSLPSPVGRCKTPKTAPWRNPKAWGKPTTPGKLSIEWERFTKIHQGGDNFKYELKYRRIADPPLQFQTRVITDFNTTSFEIPDAGTYELYEFTVIAKNDQGDGPNEPLKQTRSGQQAPAEGVAKFFVKTKGATELFLEWTAVKVESGSIDGYVVYFWNWTDPGSSSNRVRRAEPVDNAYVKRFPGGEAGTGTVGNLTSISTYYLIIKPYNSGGEGPGSDVLETTTEGTISSPPSNVNIQAFGSVLFVQWEPPLSSSGVIFDYHIIVENSSYTFTRQTGVILNSYRYEYWERFTYISNLEPTQYYTIKISARNRFGMGDYYEKIVATSFPDQPGKPMRPTLVPIDSYGINCTFNLAENGGFPTSFMVYYRPKGDLLSPVSMVTQQFPKYQWVLISGLSPNPFEFWVVARNGNGDSVPSDVVEAMPKPYAPSREEFVGAIAWYRSNWFIAACVAIAFLLLVLIVILILIQRNGTKYQVARREQARAGWNSKPPQDDYSNGAPYTDDYATRPLKNDFPVDNRPPPRYPSTSSVDKRPTSDDNDSLDDYGEDTKFDEDGSFMGQYGDEKRQSADRLNKKEDPDMSTFV